MVLINLHKISIPIKGSEAIIERAAQFAEKIKTSEEKKLASSLDFLAGQNEFLVKRKIRPVIELRNDIDLDIIKYLAKQITPKNEPYLKNLLSLPEEVLKARGKQLDVDEIYSLLKKLTPKNAPYLKGLLSLPGDVLKARGKQLSGSEISRILKQLTPKNETYFEELLSLPEKVLKARGEQLSEYEIYKLLKHLSPKNQPYLKGLLSLPEEVLKARGEQLDAWEISGILEQLTPENASSLKGLLSLPEEVLKARGKKFDGYEIAEMLKYGINTEKLEKLHKLQTFDAKEFKPNNFLNDFIKNTIPIKQKIEQMHKIQRICYGELSENTIKRVKEFEQKTGIKLHLDRDLPFENFDYLEDTMNVLKSRGLEDVKHIFITDFMPARTQGYIDSDYKNTIYYRPIGSNGCNDIEFIKGIAHEATHGRHNKLDQLEHLMFELENKKKLVTDVISKYATTEPDEFVACVGEEMIFPGKIRIEKQPDGTVEWLSDVVEPDKLKVIKELYEKFEGPEFAPTPKLIKKSKKQILSH